MTDTRGAIVVGLDGSEVARRALRWAAAEAAPRKLRLHLVVGLDPMLGYADLPIPEELFDELERLADSRLAEAADEARKVGPGLIVTTEHARVPPVPLLIDKSQTARMVVLGASGHRGFTGMMLGSTAVSVMARSACPVVVVRPGHAGGPVVVGVDGSAMSIRALETAFDEASWRGVPLVAVHAWRDVEYATTVPMEYAVPVFEPSEQEQARILSESLAGWQETYPDVTVERVVVKDRPRHQLLDWSTRAQLVVVGSRGRGGFKGLLLGSTSQALIHHAQCPVLVVRPRGADRG